MHGAERQNLAAESSPYTLWVEKLVENVSIKISDFR